MLTTAARLNWKSCMIVMSQCTHLYILPAALLKPVSYDKVQLAQCLMVQMLNKVLTVTDIAHSSA
jgi:hypothetical protein